MKQSMHGNNSGAARLTVGRGGDRFDVLEMKGTFQQEISVSCTRLKVIPPGLIAWELKQEIHIELYVP